MAVELRGVQEQVSDRGLGWQPEDTVHADLSLIRIRSRTGAVPPEGHRSMGERESAAAAWQPAFVNVEDAQDAYAFSSVGCTSLKATLHVVAAAGAGLLHGGAVPWATSAVPASTASCMS